MTRSAGMHADPDTRDTALAQAGAWLAWGRERRRGHLRSHLQVFALEDAAHPAKQLHAELLQPLGLRAVERGVRAQRVRTRLIRQHWRAAVHVHAGDRACIEHTRNRALCGRILPDHKGGSGRDAVREVTCKHACLHGNDCVRAPVQAVEPWTLLGEYCGVVKTGRQLDARAPATTSSRPCPALPLHMAACCMHVTTPSCHVNGKVHHPVKTLDSTALLTSHRQRC